jgi:hypothetical protein
MQPLGAGEGATIPPAAAIGQRDLRRHWRETERRTIYGKTRAGAIQKERERDRET